MHVLYAFPQKHSRARVRVRHAVAERAQITQRPQVKDETAVVVLPCQFPFALDAIGERCSGHITWMPCCSTAAYRSASPGPSTNGSSVPGRGSSKVSKRSSGSGISGST